MKTALPGFQLIIRGFKELRRSPVYIDDVLLVAKACKNLSEQTTVRNNSPKWYQDLTIKYIEYVHDVEELE